MSPDALSDTFLRRSLRLLCALRVRDEYAAGIEHLALSDDGWYAPCSKATTHRAMRQMLEKMSREDLLDLYGGLTRYETEMIFGRRIRG